MSCTSLDSVGVWDAPPLLPPYFSVGRGRSFVLVFRSRFFNPFLAGWKTGVDSPGVKLREVKLREVKFRGGRTLLPAALGLRCECPSATGAAWSLFTIRTVLITKYLFSLSYAHHLSS